MKRDFPIGDLKSALESGYGVRLSSIEPLAGHAHSLNYKAVTEDGRVFAAKCLPSSNGVMLARLLAHTASAGALASTRLFGGKVLDFGKWKVLALRWIDGVRIYPDEMSDDEMEGFLSGYRSFLGGLKDDGHVLPARDALRLKAALLECLSRRHLPEIVRELQLIPDESLVLSSDRVRIIHGDLHWENFRFKDGNVTGFLDLEELRFGTPAEDVIRYVVCRAEHQRWYDVGGRKRLLTAFRRFLAKTSLTRAEWLYAIDSYLLRKLDKKLSSGAITRWSRLNIGYRLGFYRSLRDAVYGAIPRERQDDRTVVKIMGGTVKRFMGSNVFDWGGRFRFVYDSSCRDYDWLCVYDEIPASRPDVDGGILRVAPGARTMLITQEPTSVKFYNRAYTEQFDVLLTNRPRESENHPGYVKGEGYMVWYTGRSFAEEAAREIPRKTKCLSAVYSSKRMSHTRHAARYRLLETIRETERRGTAEYAGIGDRPVQPIDFDWFGKGVNPIERKADALDTYKYTIAFENHVGPGHWTEKLSDALVCGCLPFYAGDPEVGNVLPEGCFVPIPSDDPGKAVEVIRSAIDGNEYEKRMGAIASARDLLFKKYNLFAQVAKAIAECRVEPEDCPSNRVLVTRRRARLGTVTLLGDVWHHFKRIRIMV